MGYNIFIDRSPSLLPAIPFFVICRYTPLFALYDFFLERILVDDSDVEGIPRKAMLLHDYVS